MKKTGFLAVSLATLMVVGAARADIASTTYVDNIAKTKQDVSNMATETYTSGDKTKYPSINVAETIAGKAVEGFSAGLGKLSGMNSVGTDEINAKAVTKAKLSDEVQASLNKADNALQEHQDISGKEDKSNKVTAISSTSTDIQYPSAKAVYTELGKKQNSLGYTAENQAYKTGTIAAADAASDTKYPTEKAVATALAGKQPTGDYATNTALDGVKSTAETANTQATANKTAIAALNGAATVDGSVAKKIKDAIDPINTAVAGKATKATTLAGYGITDAYTKTQADGKYQIKDNISTSATITDDAVGANKDVKYASAGAAKVLADAAQAAAEATAASDATSKANTAKSEAISAAAGDATTKANNALAEAKEYTNSYVADNAYSLPVATAENLGGVKSGGNITVASTGAVTVNHATSADSATNATSAASATKATNDGSNRNIVNTYQTKADSKVAADANYIKANNTVAQNLGALDTNLKTVSQTASSANTTANNALPKTTYNSQVGTVSAANMGTEATTVVAGIKEAVTEAAAAQSTANTAKTNAATAQSRADSAYNLADAAIPQPSGDCTDCVLHFNGKDFSWEEIGR